MIISEKQREQWNNALDFAGGTRTLEETKHHSSGWYPGKRTTDARDAKRRQRDSGLRSVLSLCYLIAHEGDRRYVSHSQLSPLTVIGALVRGRGSL